MIGAPGGTYIAMGVAAGIINVVDFGMSMFEAVAAPRFSATSDPSTSRTAFRAAYDARARGAGLRRRRSYQSYAFAAVHGIKIESGRWTGGADPSHDGMALAV